MPHEFFDQTGLTWSPDGLLIAFNWNPYPASGSRLAKIRVGSGEPVVLEEEGCGIVNLSGYEEQFGRSSPLFPGDFSRRSLSATSKKIAIARIGSSRIGLGVVLAGTDCGPRQGGKETVVLDERI